jgi:hypothetical protein
LKYSAFPRQMETQFTTTDITTYGTDCVQVACRVSQVPSDSVTDRQNLPTNDMRQIN